MNVLGRLLIPFLILLALDFYVFGAVRTAFQSAPAWLLRSATAFYWLLTLFLVASVIYAAFFLTPENFRVFRRIFGPALFLIYFSKFIVAIFLLLEDSTRLLRWGVAQVQGDAFSPSRSAFLSQLALFVGVAPMAALAYGTTNVYNYRIRRSDIPIADLPDEFDGFTIVQFSDVHVGTLNDKEQVARGIELMNQAGGDIICFTGDMVNSQTQEIHGWEEVFSKLDAPDGVYSVLGNHDYGLHARWESEEASFRNRRELQDIERNMGWRLLMNENRVIERNGKKLAVIGVENWGSKAYFPKYGKLDEACRGCEDADVKVLLSHDPSHWDAQVRPDQPDIDLTLSGHTHGFQFGIEWNGWQWSPSQWVYPQWAGLYTKARQHLYVNRGFGVLGYPGRVGILPEISVLTLRRA